MRVPHVACANPHCPWYFIPTRPHHRFCTGECRKQDWIRVQIEEAGRTRSTGLSRRSRTRDGCGTKLYLTPEDLAELEDGPPYSPRIEAKLDEARKRIERKR